VLFVTLGSVTYGYSSSIIGTTLGQPSFSRYFNLQSSSRSAVITGAINGVYQAGGIFGTLSTTLLAVRLGRCKTIFCGALCVVVGGALQAGSVHIAMFLVARLLTGIGIGKLRVASWDCDT
jgi:MFS family permease